MVGARSHLGGASCASSEFVVIFGDMAPGHLNAANFADRWAKNTQQAAAETLIRGGTPQGVSRALATVDPSVRTLSHRADHRLAFTIPTALQDTYGWTAGMLVRVGINERGNLEIAPLTEADLPGFAERLAEPGYLLPIPSSRPRNLMCYERTCKDCGALLQAVGRSRRYCEQCRRDRDRANWRAYWHLKGKLTPSYRRKLTRRAPAEIPAQPVLV